MKGSLSSGMSNASERVDAAAEAQAKANETVVQEPTPEPEVLNEPESQEPEIETPEASFFGGDDDEVVLDSTEDTEEPAEQAPSNAEQAIAKTLRKIKADGKYHEVDFADEEKLIKLIQKGLGADKAFTNSDKLTKENSRLIEELKVSKKFQEAMQYLEEAKEDDAELFRRMTGGRTLDDAFKKHQEHQMWLSTASKEEVDNWQLAQRLQKLEATNAQEGKLRKEAEERAAAIERNTEKRALKGEIMSEMSRVSFSGQLGDKVEEQELDELIYLTAIRSMKKWAKDNPEQGEVPEEVRRKSFDRAKRLIDRKNTEAVEKQVETIDKKRSEAAKKNAQIASTKNYGKQIDSKDLRKYASRPTELWKDLFKK